MSDHTLWNVAAWALQVAAITAVAALITRVVHVDVPALRYAWWRVVLLTCLALPLIQPWQPPDVAPPEAPPLALTLGPLVNTAAPARPSAPAQPASSAGPTELGSILAVVLVGGVALRLGWMLVGLVRLRRFRSMGTPADLSAFPEERDALASARAQVRTVPGLRQPVTFGLLRPIVLLPPTLHDMPLPVQRAVVVHELWHVRRRDWLWSLGEEMVRAIFWFHPAVSYLVARVQISREEVVDELTVLSTNARRSYLEALLAFADQPDLYPAAPFARRRQLFERMLLISKEAVMSSNRVVVSGVTMIGILAVSGWYGALAFPLTATVTGAAASGSQGQVQPRDPRPDVARPASSREQDLQAALASDPTNVVNWLTLAKLQEERGALQEAESAYTTAVRATGGSRQVLLAMASFFTRRGDFDRAVGLLEDAAAQNPTDPAGHQLVATYYWEKAQKDQSLTPAEKERYILAGIAATDRALTQNPDYLDALTYKNILLRLQGNLPANASRREQLYAEADLLRNRAMELARLTRPSQFPTGPGAPPPPPPPPGQHHEVDGVRAVRIGGEIKTPTKLRHVAPVYPADALAARVSGLVIVEAVLDAGGNVRSTRVLRSIPMLDQAALDAVQQWRFTPTEINGTAVPVVMTVTVNFTLQ